MTLKEQLISALGPKDQILCAKVCVGLFDQDPHTTFLLRVGYSDEQLEELLNVLDTESDYETCLLGSTIWLTPVSWFEVELDHEYEHTLMYRYCNQIPEELL